MEKGIKRKIRNKIWIVAFTLLISYVSALIIDPTIWLTLLPIAFPAGILTCGIPLYAITKNIKETTEMSNIDSNNKTEIEENKNIFEHEKNINMATFNQQYEMLDDCYEINQEKNKLKTKGTIH